MGSIFQKTSKTLVQKMIADRECVDQRTWKRFDDLYRPAMLKFVEWKRGPGHAEAEDIVMEVMAKLADAFREGKYSPVEGAKFRSYLATLLANQIVIHHRADMARGGGRFVELDKVAETASVEPEAMYKLDMELRLAQHAAAEEKVLSSAMVSARDKAIWRAYVTEGRPIAEVAKEFGLWKNTVSQVKTRIARKIAAVEARFEE